MEFKIIDKYEDFVLISEKYNELISNIEDPEVFYKYEWLNNYLNHFNPGLKDKLCIVVGTEKEKIIIVLPFILSERVLSFITEEITDYNSIFVDKGYNRFTLIKKTVDYLIGNVQFEEVILNNFKSISELYILKDVLENIGYTTFLKEQGMIPKIERGINQTKFNKKQIKDIERRLRNLQKEHSVEFEDVPLSESILEFIMKNKGIKFNKENVDTTREINFYLSLEKDMPESVSVSLCKLDGVIVAAHLGFCEYDKFYYYMPAYEMELSNTGVGIILLKYLIDKNIESKTFDFLKGTESYKYYWSDTTESNFSLKAYSSNQRFKILKNKVKNRYFARLLMKK